METDVENECTGEILYATSYGLNIGRTLYHTSLNKVTDAWIESVKVQKKVVCENTAWADFELTTDIVLEQNDKPEIVAMRRFCYKSFCQNISSFFGITTIYLFLNKIFKRNHVMDSTDIMYKMFIDSMLYDVRFIVCVRLPRIAINLNREYADETENRKVDDNNYYNSNNAGDRSVILSPDEILTNLANDNDLANKLKSSNKLYVDNESIYSASDDGILSRYENEMNNTGRPDKLVKNYRPSSSAADALKNRNTSYAADMGDSYSDIFDNYNDFSESEEGSLNSDSVVGGNNNNRVESDGTVSTLNKLSMIPNVKRATSKTTTDLTESTTTTVANNNNSSTTTIKKTIASTRTASNEDFNNGVVSKTTGDSSAVASATNTDATVSKYENERIEKEKAKSYYNLSFLDDRDEGEVENNVVATTGDVVVRVAEEEEEENPEDGVEEENGNGEYGRENNEVKTATVDEINESVDENVEERQENDVDVNLSGGAGQISNEIITPTITPGRIENNKELVVGRKRKTVGERENVESANSTNNFEYDEGERITYEIDGPWLAKRRKKSKRIRIDEIENIVEMQEEGDDSNFDSDVNVEMQEGEGDDGNVDSDVIVEMREEERGEDGGNVDPDVEIKELLSGDDDYNNFDNDDEVYRRAEELLRESASRIDVDVESVEGGGSGDDGDTSVPMDIEEELRLEQFLIKSQNIKRKKRRGELEENVDLLKLLKSSKYRSVEKKKKPKRLQNQFVKRRLVKSNSSGIIRDAIRDEDKENVNTVSRVPVVEEEEDVYGTMQLAKPLGDSNNDIREEGDYNISTNEEIIIESDPKMKPPAVTTDTSTPPTHPLSLVRSSNRKRRIIRERNEEEYEAVLPPSKIRKVYDDDAGHVRRQSRARQPLPPDDGSATVGVVSYNDEEEEYYANLASGGVEIRRESVTSYTEDDRIETFSTPAASEMSSVIENTTSGSRKSSKEKNVIRLPELLFIALNDNRHVVESERITTNLYEEKIPYTLFKGIILDKYMDDNDLQTYAKNNIVLFYTVNRKLDGSAVMKLSKHVNNTRDGDDNYYLEMRESIIDDIIHKLFGQRSDKSNFNIRRFTVEKANLNITMENVLHLLFKRFDVSTATATTAETPKRGSIRV